MALSSLDDRSREPTDDDVREVLLDAHAVWAELNRWLEAEAGVDRFEWAFAGKKYGWSSRAVRQKRRIAYLIPGHGSFLVGLVLGDRAVAAAREADLSAATRETIDAAPRYGEGTGFRLPVALPADLADVRTLVGIKLRH
jgi:hypothetical protein